MRRLIIFWKGGDEKDFVADDHDSASHQTPSLVSPAEDDDEDSGSRHQIPTDHSGYPDPIFLLSFPYPDDA